MRAWRKSKHTDGGNMKLLPFNLRLGIRVSILFRFSTSISVENGLATLVSSYLRNLYGPISLRDRDVCVLYV